MQQSPDHGTDYCLPSLTKATQSFTAAMAPRRKTETDERRARERRAEAAKKPATKPARKTAAKAKETDPPKKPGASRKALDAAQQTNVLKTQREAEAIKRTKQGVKLDVILTKFREGRPLSRNPTIEESRVAFNWQRSLSSLISLLKQDAAGLDEGGESGLFQLAIVVLDQGVTELKRLSTEASEENLEESPVAELRRAVEFVEGRTKKPKKAKTRMQEIDEVFEQAAAERKKTLRTSTRKGSLETEKRVRKRKRSYP